MNSVELMVIDLVAIAEAPLYSTYRWMGQRLGRELPLGEFVRLVDELIARDVLRLWEVDYGSHDRTELFGVPDDLENRYRATTGLDDSFDPFGLSLTLGPAADVEAEPSWEADFDFEVGRFELLAEAGHDDDAVKEASRYFRDVVLVAERRESAGDRVRIVGRMEAP